jgi:hypothetical protein
MRLGCVHLGKTAKSMANFKPCSAMPEGELRRGGEDKEEKTSDTFGQRAC